MKWQSDPIEILIKKAVDPDYGDCLYCYINGKKMHYYVRAGEGAEEHLLKGVIAEYHTKQIADKKKYEKLERFQDSCRQLLAMAKEVLL